MNDEAADRAALARMAAGDERALEEIAGRYHARLWRYLHRQLGASPQAIEEVLQDIYLALWQSATRYRGDASPATWIFRIARYLMLNARKVHARGAAHIPLAISGEEVGALVGDSPETAVVARIALTDALRTLSPKHAEVLELIANEGFTLHEVAEILDIPLGTVKSRLTYARRALAAALDGENLA